MAGVAGAAGSGGRPPPLRPRRPSPGPPPGGTGRSGRGVGEQAAGEGAHRAAAEEGDPVRTRTRPRSSRGASRWRVESATTFHRAKPPLLSASIAAVTAVVPLAATATAGSSGAAPRGRAAAGRRPAPRRARTPARHLAGTRRSARPGRRPRRRRRRSAAEPRHGWRRRRWPRPRRPRTSGRRAGDFGPPWRALSRRFRLPRTDRTRPPGGGWPRPGGRCAAGEGWGAGLMSPAGTACSPGRAPRGVPPSSGGVRGGAGT